MPPQMPTSLNYRTLEKSMRSSVDFATATETDPDMCPTRDRLVGRRNFFTWIAILPFVFFWSVRSWSVWIAYDQPWEAALFSHRGTRGTQKEERIISRLRGDGMSNSNKNNRKRGAQKFLQFAQIPMPHDARLILMRCQALRWKFTSRQEGNNLQD